MQGNINETIMKSAKKTAQKAKSAAWRFENKQCLVTSVEALAKAAAAPGGVCGGWRVK